MTVLSMICKYSLLPSANQLSNIYLLGKGVKLRYECLK